MPSDPVVRRLAAILAGDVAGYSRLMGADEMRTVAALRAHRQEVIDPKLAEHRGRLVNTAGDSVLVEFPSVLDAVRCAVEMQQVLSARNVDVPADQRIVFRIGINIGDVIFQGGEVYGDGVNIAARLEQLAEPGGVLVSRTVREQVGDKLPYVFDELGPREVKNIAQPVDVWRVRWDAGREPAATQTVPHRPPGETAREARPSIAVLPFQSMSGDAEQEYFSDGLTEDLTTHLAALPQLRVIARNTMFTYKGRASNVQQVGRELGVSYALEGRIRKSGNRVRVTAQLIEAATGSHLWAGRYDRELTDVFAIQDEIVQTIVTELHANLLEGEQVRNWRRATRDVQALEEYGRAQFLLRNIRSLGDLERATQHLERALARDADFWSAYSELALTFRIRAVIGPRSSFQAALQRSSDCAHKAIELNPAYAPAYTNLGYLALLRGDYRDGEALMGKAVELAPTASGAKGHHAVGLLAVDQKMRALRTIEEAMGMAPRYAPWMDGVKITILFNLQRYADALQWISVAQERGSSLYFYQTTIIACHIALDHFAEAQSAIQILLDSDPEFRIATHMERSPLSPHDREHLAGLLRKAGLPE